jgi:hypothetical protein
LDDVGEAVMKTANKSSIMYIIYLDIWYLLLKATLFKI